MLRVPGMRSDHVCLTVVLDGKTVALVGLDFQLCAKPHTHTYTAITGRQAKTWNTAPAVVLLLLQFCSCIRADFVTAHTPRICIYILYLLPTAEHKRTHIHIHIVCETAKTKRARSTTAVVQWLPRVPKSERHVWYSSSSSRARKTLLVCGGSRVLKSLVVAASDSVDRYF